MIHVVRCTYLQGVGLEEGQDLIEQHRVKGAFLVIHGAGQFHLNLGFALDWGAVDWDFLITDELDTFADLEVLERSCNAIQNGEQFQFQAGGNIGVGTILVRLVQVLDLAEVRSRPRCLLLWIMTVVDRVRVDRLRCRCTVGQGHRRQAAYHQ